MYDSGPSDEELAAIGIKREDVEDTSLTEIWPENELALKVFCEVSSQWRTGANGPTGLDDNVVFKFMDLMKIKRSKQLAVIRDIKVLERSALIQMGKK